MDGARARSLYFSGVICADWPTNATEADVRQAVSDATEVAPHFADLVATQAACVSWPYAPAGLETADGKGAGPVLVLNPTDDPATPLKHARGSPTGYRTPRS